MSKIDAIIIGSGPVASLISGSINHEKHGTAWLCFPDKEQDLKNNGLFIRNHPDKVMSLVPKQILSEKNIPADQIQFGAEEIQSGKLHIYTSPLPPQNIDIADDVVIFFTTKSFDNANLLNQVKPILETKKAATIVLIQNGVAPEHRLAGLLKEMGLSTKVIRGVPMGPVTYLSPGYLENGIFKINFGNWDAKQIGTGEIEKTASQICGMFDLLYGEVHLDDFVTISASKVLANLINSNAVIFGSNCGEAINSRFLHELYQAKANEGIIVFGAYGANIKSLPSLDTAYSMFDTTRPHIPSMGRDPLVFYQGGESFPFPLNTEIGDMDGQIVQFGDDLKIGTYWNSWCTDIINDFCKSVNEIRQSKGHDTAAEFGLRFIARNRHVAGVEPYILDRWYGHEFPVLKDYEQHVKEKFQAEDTNINKKNGHALRKQAVYLCGHLAYQNKNSLSLSALIIAGYRDLKRQYQDLLSDPLFKLREELCQRRTYCETPCQSLLNR